MPVFVLRAYRGFLGALLFLSFTALGDDRLTGAVTETLQRAKASALHRRAAPEYWNLPLYMGANYVAQAYLMRFWLAQDPQFNKGALAPFDEERFRGLLLNTQMPDGSWQPTADPGLETGTLDATIMNYWALKVIGEDVDGVRMTRARNYIKLQGGLEKASTFSRLVLALFGQLSWNSLPSTPLFLIEPSNPAFMNLELFPQWVRPHIVPITYLGTARVQRDLGPRFSLAELHGFKHYPPRFDRYTVRSPELRKVVEQMLSAQAPLGSWGGYTSATLFTAAALSDYLVTSHDQSLAGPARAAMNKGLSFVDDLYLNERGGAAYLGSVCDGRLWDTILMLQGLLSIDRSLPEAHGVVEYLKKNQVPNGGIPFGLDFESTPDLDDTAEFVTTLRLHDSTRHTPAILRALGLLGRMQNADGGWGAFDHENNGNVVLNYLTSGLSDSANLFDPSTPDVAGHVLEAFGVSGFNQGNSDTVRRGVEYLRGTVGKDGTWSGRWGVNYIYGTSAAVSGLIKVGVPLDDPLIERGLAWIESRQNADGGFGESTRSYLEPGFAGRGVSTPSQTAWALMALVRGGRAHGAEAKRAVRYLLESAQEDGSWVDAAVVGTGHVGIVYLNYPAYPLAFPMIALGEYLRAVPAIQARTWR